MVARWHTGVLAVAGARGIGAIGAAVAHIPLIDEHLTEAPYIGAGFVLLSIAGLFLGHLLLQADTPAVWLATATLAALALAGYLLSRTIGLPQIHDDIGNWGEPLGIAAISSEALMLASAVAHWAGVRRTQCGADLRVPWLRPP